MRSEFKEGYSFQAEYEDESFEMLISETAEKAINEAMTMESEHGGLMNIILIDEEYNEIETIF